MSGPLEFTAGQMRAMGYRVIDLLVEHLSTLSDSPVGAKGDPAKLLAQFSGPPPETAAVFESVLDQVAREVLPKTLPVYPPRFFAYVPGPGNFVGAMGKLAWPEVIPVSRCPIRTESGSSTPCCPASLGL